MFIISSLSPLRPRLKDQRPEGRPEVGGALRIANFELRKQRNCQLCDWNYIATLLDCRNARCEERKAPGNSLIEQFRICARILYIAPTP